MIQIIFVVTAYMVVGYFLTLWFVTTLARWAIETKAYGQWSVDIATDGTIIFFLLGVFLWPMSTPMWFFLAWCDFKKKKKKNSLQLRIQKRLRRQGVIK